MDKKNQDSQILIIESNLPVREMMSFLLEMEKYRVISVSNGEEGIDIIRKSQNISCVITNYKRNGLDGIETIKQIKNIRESLSTILITSFFWLRDDVSKIKRTGFIEKTFEISELIDCIKSLSHSV
tara:strand:+ start:122 stop:499 length:378 start_codon:yes stop_codon:yes gene_type:complete